MLTGGPKLAEVGATAGSRVPAGGARHQVVVTAPVTAFNVHDVPMVFDLPSGIYWRPGEAGGLLWGMSNPEEAPGVAADFDEIYYQKVRGRIEELLPGLKGLGLRRTWAATIDYTPDHLPILGPLLTDDGPVQGTVVASPAGHGMMWGPAVAEVAVDLTMTGRCDWLDLTDLGLDRFDADGNSRVAPEPISLPFPEKARNVNTISTAILAQAADAELEDWGTLEEATGDPMATHGVEMWVDGGKSAGIWQCTPGPSYWVQEENEVIYLLSGRMTVTPDGGEPSEVGTGDIAVFPTGWKGTWDIHETVRKVYSIF